MKLLKRHLQFITGYYDLIATTGSNLDAEKAGI